MPLYEYKCSRCKDEFEVLQKFSDAPLRVCRKCGGGLERLISTPSIQFKGPGWYVTDYARKASKQEENKSEEKKTPSRS